MLSSDYGPGRRQMAIVFSIMPAIGITWSAANLLGGNHSGTVITNLLVWAVVVVMIWAAAREPLQVTLSANSLRVRSGRRVREIPLWRVRSVELDFPRRGRQIFLLVEREGGSDPTLESIEFMPRDVGMGFGGGEVADYLRRRVSEARAVHTAT